MPAVAPDEGLAYDVVDVFADVPFAGNQLAVVHGTRGLSDAQLQAIAQEFNYSETTFPTPLATDRYSVRIFTPGGEIPFAGHPTLGTSWVLRQAGVLTGPTATQLCDAGEIGVVLGVERVRLYAERRDLVGPVAASTVSSLLADVGLGEDDLRGEVWLAGTGLTFVHLPVSDEAVVRAHVSTRALASYADLAVGCLDPVAGINLYAATGAGPAAVHSRVFVPGLSVAEDPATGSAATGLGMALMATGFLPEGGSYEIRQGLELGRPSRLYGGVAPTGPVEVGGRVQPIASGRIAVPAHP